MTSNQLQFLRRLIGPLFLPTFSTALLLGIAEPVLPLYLQDAGASYAAVGVVISALEIGRLLASLPSSAVLSRLAMRHTMLAGMGIVVAALLLMALVDAVWVVFACWLLAGVGLTLYEISRHQFIATHIKNHQRGRSVSIIGGLFRLGNVVGPALGGWAAQAFSFQAAFLLMAGFAMATAVVTLRYIPPAAAPNVDFSLPAYTRALGETFRQYRRVLLAAGSGQLLMQLVRRTRMVVVPLYAANILGLDVAAVGLVVSAGSLVDTAFFWVAGIIVDRYGRKFAIIPSLLLQATGLLLLPLAASLPAMLAVVSLMGFANGISAGTMLTLGADLAPVESRTEFLGLWRISNALGFALGPNVIGGVAAVLTLPLASVTAGVIGLFAAGLFYRLVPETLVKDP